MKYLMRYITYKFKNLRALVHRICTPNIKYAKNKLDQEINHSRLKAIFTIHLFVILFMLFRTFLRSDDATTNLVSIVMNALLIIVMLMFKRLHPEIIKTMYNILTSLTPILIVIYGENGVQRTWMMIPLYPSFILWYTGSSKHFFIQSAMQYIYLNTFYQQKMLHALNTSSPENFVQTLLAASNRMLVLNMIIPYLIQTYVEKAHQTAFEAEKTKVEFESQKTFLLGFSHELRNLLNSLMGNVKLISFEDINEKSKEYLGNANLCGELLLHLVNNILDTGKSEIEDLEVTPVPTNICEELEKIWSICSQIIQRKNLNGTLRVKKNVPPTMKIDHHRLTQVILNLVGNAVKFTESGSVDIKVEWLDYRADVNEGCFEPCPFNNHDDFSEGILEKEKSMSILDTEHLMFGLANKRIDPSLLRQRVLHTQGILKITVSDTGCGLSSDNLKRLFQKFTQVSSDSSKRKLGTGLGLFITKQICEKMDGQIKAFSRESYGSCFVVCIPADTITSINSIHMIERTATENALRPRGLKAIIVDDDSLSLTILKAFLTKIDVTVTALAKNGLEGFQKYADSAERHVRPNIVTMDLEMPVMDGKKAAEKIRELEKTRGVEPCLLIVISGNCSKSEIAECMNPNGKIRADAFLKKPVRIEDLKQVIFEKMRIQ